MNDETAAARDLRAAAMAAVALAVLGALLGIAWSAWSGPQQRAYVVAPGKLFPFDEVETMAGADGRFVALTGVVGLLAGVIAYHWRRGARGPAMALGLAAGGVGGAALTWWVGYLTGGGTYDGKANTTIAHLPLTLHMHGMLLVESAAALLVYGLFTAFAVRDDLGRPDPVRERLLVRSRGHADDSRGDGDTASAPQEADFAP